MATQDDLDSLDQQIQDHKDYLIKLQQLSDSVARRQPTGYYSFGRGLAQFNKDRQAKLLEIERQSKRSQQDYRDLNRQRQTTATKLPGAKQATPLSEAGQLAENERQRKVEQDQADQGPQKRQAESQLEQQKAADAASIPALGASIPTKTGGAQPQSLKDLLTKFQMRPDRTTGEYVFSRPNDEQVLTPGQTRANTQLAAALKPAGLQPEQVFGPGVPAPVFDPKTGISNGVGNPFVGKKSDYDALAGLYQQAQPSPNTELRVPTGALDRAYQATAPAYGPTFPANPVDIDRKTPAAVALAGMGQPGEVGYVPRAPVMDTRDALMQGKAAADVDSFSKPITLNALTANPITQAPTDGLPSAIEPPDQPLTQIGTQPPATGAALLAGAAKGYGVPEQLLADVRARKQALVQSGDVSQEDADAAEKQAVAQLSAQAKLATTVPEAGNAAALTLSAANPVGALKLGYSAAGPIIDNVTKSMEDEQKKREAVAALAGTTPVQPEDLYPSLE